MEVSLDAFKSRQPALAVNQRECRADSRKSSKPSQPAVLQREHDKNQQKNVMQKIQREIAESRKKKFSDEKDVPKAETFPLFLFITRRRHVVFSN